MLHAYKNAIPPRAIRIIDIAHYVMNMQPLSACYPGHPRGLDAFDAAEVTPLIADGGAQGLDGTPVK